jgi:hypothetical protein
MASQATQAASLSVMLGVFVMILLGCKTCAEKAGGPMLDTRSQNLIEQLNSAIAANDHPRVAQALIDIGLRAEGHPKVEEALEAAYQKVRFWRLPEGIDWPGGKSTVTVPGPRGIPMEVAVADGWGRRNTFLSTLLSEAMWKIHLRTGYGFRRFEQRVPEKEKGGE